ncbi:hypothetical protein IGI66_002026 [Enterococcus sp. AZ048]|uniref:hypothetical protein n=1 Tax=Enterococcus sp. AZ048 TaxID=2774658 RepID=UPI003F25A577
MGFDDCEWLPINECLDMLNVENKLEGVYIVGFEDVKEIEFNGNNDNKSFVSETKLREYYDQTDKRILLIASTKDLYKSIEVFTESYESDIFPNKLNPKSAKVIWQMKNRPELKVSFFITTDTKNMENLFLQEYKLKNKIVPIGNKVFNNNDAIPTWSGFNYQGKGIILRALQLINENWSSSNSEEENEELIKKYFIEIELREDFVIYHLQEPIEYVQVKATLASKTYSGYTKAIKQLLDHRDEGTNPKVAKCVLMSAIPIKGWVCDEPVSLYKYNNECVGLLEIPKCIKREISILLGKMNQTINDFKVEVIYENLCGMLDQKVREIHKNNESYELQLEENIWENVKLSISNQKRNAYFTTYESIYNLVSENLTSVVESRCKECKLGYSEYNCNTCTVPLIRDNFISTNLIDYVPVLNPDTIFGNTYPEKIAVISETFSKKSINRLLHQFEFAYVDNYYWYPSAHLLDMGYGNQIIPTLLDFSTHTFKKSVSTSLSNIVNNFEIHDEINGKALTVVKPELVSTNIMEKNVTSYKQMENKLLSDDGFDVEKKNSNSYKIDVTLVDRTSLIKDLKEKSDKCE